MKDALRDKLARAVVTVGCGRGFIVRTVHPFHQRVVITAAHCLPHFPPSNAASHTEERTYARLLGALGTEPTVWAECLFVDPIADVAALGAPDGQELGDKAEAFGELVDESPAFVVGAAQRDCPAWLLMLAGHWSGCQIQQNGGPLWIEGAAEGIHGGMSGSPIVTDDGKAVGLVSIGVSVGEEHVSTSGGPNPRLTHHLPGWLLAALDVSKRHSVRR